MLLLSSSSTSLGSTVATTSSSIRVKVVFADVLGTFMNSTYGYSQCWRLISSDDLKHVGDFQYELLVEYELLHLNKEPGRVRLLLDNYELPPLQPISVLRDGDLVQLSLVDLPEPKKKKKKIPVCDSKRSSSKRKKSRDCLTDDSLNNTSEESGHQKKKKVKHSKSQTSSISEALKPSALTISTNEDFKKRKSPEDLGIESSNVPRTTEPAPVKKKRRRRRKRGPKRRVKVSASSEDATAELVPNNTSTLVEEEKQSSPPSSPAWPSPSSSSDNNNSDKEDSDDELEANTSTLVEQKPASPPSSPAWPSSSSDTNSDEEEQPTTSPESSSSNDDNSDDNDGGVLIPTVYAKLPFKEEGLKSKSSEHRHVRFDNEESSTKVSREQTSSSTSKYGPMSRNDNQTKDFEEQQQQESVQRKRWNIPRGGFEWKRPYTVLSSDDVVKETCLTDFILKSYPEVTSDVIEQGNVIAFRELLLCKETWQPVLTEFHVCDVIIASKEELGMRICDVKFEKNSLEYQKPNTLNAFFYSRDAEHVRDLRLIDSGN